MDKPVEDIAHEPHHPRQIYPSDKTDHPSHKHQKTVCLQQTCRHKDHAQSGNRVGKRNHGWKRETEQKPT
jgi:hypothetical protein